jgi:hypothetical protein
LTTPSAPPLSPAEDLARALARFLDAAPQHDPWARFPVVLEVDHVAEVMGMEPSAVREQARRGGIPMTKRLNRYVVAQDVLRAWLLGKEVV